MKRENCIDLVLNPGKRKIDYKVLDLYSGDYREVTEIKELEEFENVRIGRVISYSDLGVFSENVPEIVKETVKRAEKKILLIDNYLDQGHLFEDFLDRGIFDEYHNIGG